MTTVQTEPSVTVPGLPTDEVLNEYIQESAPMNYVDVIETVISSLAQEDTAMVNHGESGHLWKFKYGTVQVYVQLTGTTDDDTFTVWSPVLKLPVQNEAQLMAKLMGMNWGQTFEARYAVVDQGVVVVYSRIVADLSAGEISRAITIVAAIADESDEPLQKEFPAA
jgi:hypothetical protein